MSDTPQTDNNAYECIQRFEMGGSITAEKQSCQQGDCVSADFARKLERERDDAREKLDEALSDRDAWARLCGAVDCYSPSTAEPYEELKLQRDNIRLEADQLSTELHLERFSLKEMNAEIARLKAENATLRNAQMCCESCDETVTVETLRELRADKARLDWIKALDCDSPVWGVLCDTTKLRETIDAAMKGEL